MSVDSTLVGRVFPPTRPYTVTREKVREFATATGDPAGGSDGIPATFPIVLAFDAMNEFLAAERIDLFRIVHGEQKFHYERPLRFGDELTAVLTVASLRQIGGNDIIGTTSEIRDGADQLVCTATATLLHRGDQGDQDGSDG